MKPKFNASLNVLKLAAVWAVVVLHAPVPDGRLAELFNCLSRFAVPVFFMASGYFCPDPSAPNALAHMRRKTARVFWFMAAGNAVYLLFELALCVLRSQPLRTWFAANLTRQTLRYFVLYGLSPVGYHLWFLTALLTCFLVVWAFYALDFMRHDAVYALIPVCLLLGLVLGEAATAQEVRFQQVTQRNWLTLGLGFFLLGHYLRRYGQPVAERVKTRTLWLLALGGSAVAVAERWMLSEAVDLYLGSCVAATALFLLALKCPDACAAPRWRWAVWLGGRPSFLIYLLHPIFGKLYTGALTARGLEGSALMVLRPVSTVAVSTAASAVLWALWQAVTAGARRTPASARG